MTTIKKINLIYGDITIIPVDTIVSSANKSLLGGGGLDYIIHKKAGDLMKQACFALNQKKGGCPVGDAEITIAGELPVKFVIHAVGPRWLNGNKNEIQLLSNAYSSALDRAELFKIKNIKFIKIF